MREHLGGRGQLGVDRRARGEAPARPRRRRRHDHEGGQDPEEAGPLLADEGRHGRGVVLEDPRGAGSPKSRTGSLRERTSQMGRASISKSCRSRIASARSAALIQPRMRIRRLATRSCAASSRSSRARTLFWRSSISRRTARARSTIAAGRALGRGLLLGERPDRVHPLELLLRSRRSTGRRPRAGSSTARAPRPAGASPAGSRRGPGRRPRPSAGRRQERPGRSTDFPSSSSGASISSREAPGSVLARMAARLR